MTRLMTFFLSPLGVLCVLLVVAIWCVVTDRRRMAVLMLIGGMGWIYVWSCPTASEGVTRWWEARYPVVAVEKLPMADIVVTLGGAMGEAEFPRQHPDLGQAADRLWHAARVHRAGKATTILVSGGGRGKASEAAVSVSFLTDLGVPSEAILLEERSLNTIQNARESAVVLEKLGVNRILLVTSATHMPRALRAFRHAGLDPIPVPTDFQGVTKSHGWLRWLPSSDALDQSSVAIKELVGTAWYRMLYRVPAPDNSADR